MEYVVNKGEIVVLEKGDAYKVLNFVEKDGVGYVCLYKFEDGDAPLSFNVKNVVFAREVVEDEDYFLDRVTDENLVKELTKLYKKN